MHIDEPFVYAAWTIKPRERPKIPLMLTRDPRVIQGNLGVASKNSISLWRELKVSLGKWCRRSRRKQKLKIPLS